MDAVRNPGVLCSQPTSPEKIQRALAEMFQAILLLVRVSARWVCIRTPWRSGHLGGLAHQSAETENGEQGASAIRSIEPGRGIVIFADHPLAIVQDFVFALHHGIGRQASLALPTLMLPRVG